MPLLVKDGMLWHMRTPAISRSSRLALSMLLAAAAPTLAASAGAEPDDLQRARRAVQAGTYVPLETIVADAQRRHPGRVLEVDLDDHEYEIEILRGDGTKVELEYDARTGELLDEDEDD